MGRIYSVAEVLGTSAAALDLVHLVAASSHIIKLHEFRIGQDTDAGDAQAELIEINIARSTGPGTGGAVFTTPEPSEVGDAAADVTARTGDTTQATYAGTPLVVDTFNIQAGWLYLPTPEIRDVIPPSGNLVIALPNPPNSTIAWKFTLKFEEIG